VPPRVLNWNDADDNNAFHCKLMVMDFDGTISTEVALYNKKDEYDDIVTHGLPLGNDKVHHLSKYRAASARSIAEGPPLPNRAEPGRLMSADHRG
jgi:hypothetical protein